MNAIAVLPRNAVTLHGTEAYTTSIKVAEAFNKRHDDVLKKLTTLECSPEFNARNFAEIEYKDSRGRMNRAYEMTREGLMFVVMGFTGKKATAIKEAFLARFREMEEKLRGTHPQQVAQYPTQGSLTLTYEQRHFRILWRDGQPWFVAVDVASGLGLRDSNVILRYLEDHQRDKVSHGRTRLNIISLEGFNIATLHADELSAEKLRRWVAQVLATAKAPGNALPELEMQQALPAPATSEDAMRQLIGTKRFTAWLTPNGELSLRETDPDAVIMRPDQLPGWIQDPAGCPRDVLPALLAAISQRLGGGA